MFLRSAARVTRCAGSPQLLQRSSTAMVPVRMPLQTARRFQAGRPVKSNSISIVNFEEGTTRLLHMTNTALMVLTPVALVLSPSALNMPVDLALGVIVPVHSHIGMNAVVADYLHGGVRSGARYALIVFHALMFLGLLKLNVSGAGITETVKALWRKPKKE